MLFKKNAGVAETDSAEEDDSWLTLPFKKRKMSSVAVEAQRYFQEAVIDGKEKPQMFWKSKEKIFSTLAAMARDVLAVPATSTSSERAFSRGKLIIDQSRSCFSPEKFVR